MSLTSSCVQADVEPGNSTLCVAPQLPEHYAKGVHIRFPRADGIPWQAIVVVVQHYNDFWRQVPIRVDWHVLDQTCTHKEMGSLHEVVVII